MGADKHISVFLFSILINIFSVADSKQPNNMRMEWFICQRLKQRIGFILNFVRYFFKFFQKLGIVNYPHLERSCFNRLPRFLYSKSVLGFSLARRSMERIKADLYSPSSSNGAIIAFSKSYTFALSSTISFCNAKVVIVTV